MSTTSSLIPIRMRVRMTALFMPRRNRNCLHMQVGWLQEAPERDPAGSIARETLIKSQNQCFLSFKPPRRFPILCTAPPFRISPLSLSPSQST